MSGPGRMLLELILGAIAIGGFMYGMHWKTIVTDMRLEQDKKSPPTEMLKKLEDLEQQNLDLIRKVEQLEALQAL